MAYVRDRDHPWHELVETPTFENRARGRLTSEEAEAVKTMIAANPKCGDVIPGTGGVRKVRFAAGGKGKSGGVRIIYFYYNETMPVYLLSVYAKSEQADLSQETKNEMRKTVKAIVRGRGGVR